MKKFATVLTLCSMPIFAQSFIEETATETVEYFESFHKYVSTNWDETNSRIDSFFASETYEDEIPNSYVRFNFLTAVIEGEGIKNDYNIRFKTDFPNTTRNIQLVFSKDSTDPADVDGELDPKDITPQDLDKTYKDATYSAAIRFLLTENKKWNIHTDTGIKSDLPLNPFVKLRLRRSFPFLIWTTNIIQQVNYYKQERLKESTTFEIHHKVSDIFQLTLDSSLSWTYETDTFSINHGLTLYQKATDKRAYSYSIGAHASTEPTIFYDSYSINFGARQLAYKDWFFIQSNIGASFPKSNDFKMKKSVTVSAEVFF